MDTAEWYHPYTDNVISGDLMNGAGEGTFEPHDGETRAMVVTILWRLQGTPSAAYTAVFADVPEGQWYTEAICWAAEHKIVEGYGNGLFGTGDEMTREQLATVLFRFARYSGYTTCIKGKLSSFSDAGLVSPWAENAILWAQGNGIMEGRADGVLDPKSSAQRCEIAKMLTIFQQNTME